MITSAEHRGWPGDVVISDLGGAGLPAPSHQPAVFGNVSGKDRRQTPLDPFRH
jgi:mRNA interferase MazF